MNLSKIKKRWAVVPAVVVLAVAAAVFGMPRGKASNVSAATYRAVRQPLKVTVLESGSLKALKSQEIKCDVEGQTTIINLIPEGTFITEEDVQSGRILVELDSADLRDKITQHEITLQSAEASYTQARESFDIQANQNESNIKKGELTAKFARMDLDKYLGARLADQYFLSPVSFIMDELVEDPRLGGEALQGLRKLRNEIDLAREEVKRAETKKEWTRLLEEKKYVSNEELQADELALTRCKVSYEQSLTALDIFICYDFPKEVEKRLSDCQEAFKELDRIRAQARSEIAKAEAELKSSEAAYRVQTERNTRLQEQLAACVIRAKQPGLVVYATSDNPWQRQPPLEEGVNVRERQVLIILPDTSTMAAEIKVHEAVIDKVKIGQAANIKLDAYSDLEFEGHVSRVAMLPDPQQRWLNPDLKVYAADVTIHGQHKLLKPGLSAKVEVRIDELADALVVPIQAVVPRGEEHFCFVMTQRGSLQMPVETGLANDQFIEIKKGLSEGDPVMLNPPRYSETDGAAGQGNNGAGPRDGGQRENGSKQRRPRPGDEGESEERKQQDEQPAEASADDEQPGDALAEGAPAADAGTDGSDAQMRRMFSNMPQEERDKLMKKLMEMPQEEREKFTKASASERAKLIEKARRELRTQEAPVPKPQ